jgi:hypothetical protein
MEYFMKISTKAVIYSGIVFPGAGYFFVGSKTRGISSIVATLGCLAFIMVETFYKAQVIAQQIIDSGLAPTSFDQIQQMIATTPGILPEMLLTGAYIVIGLIWIGGLIDCYRIGKKLNRPTH